MRNFGRKLFLSWLSKFKRVPKALKGQGLEFAFSAGGKDWYKWQVIETMPILRIMMAADYIEQLQTGAERDDIVSYLDVVAKAINEQTIDRAKLAVVTEQLRQRMTMITNTDLLYKVASVYYVSDSEALAYTTIDAVEEKASFFKQSMPIDDFFLKTQLSEFIPLSSISQLNLRQYSKAELIERKERLQSLSLFLSSLTSKDEDLMNSLSLRISSLKG